MTETEQRDEATDARPDGAPQTRGLWSRYRLHFHIGFGSVLTIVIAVAVLIFLSMSLSGRAIVLPDWVAERVETRLNRALPEGAITLRQFEIGVTKGFYPRLKLVDVGLRDASGLDIAQFNTIEGGVRLGPLFRGQLVPRTAILSGAQITFRRLSDGSFALQFGQGAIATGNLADMIDAVDSAFVAGILSEAGRVRAEGLTITLEDARTGRLWQVTNGQLSLQQTERIIETEVTFDVFNQTEDLAAVDLSLRSDKSTSEATLSVTFENAGASDIGAQSPALSFLQLVDAPMSGALRTTIDAEGALSDFAGVLRIDEGAVRPTPGAPPVEFGGAKGYVEYDPEADVLNLSSLTFSSELGEIELDGRVFFTDYAAGWPQSMLGQVRLNRARLTDARFFDDPLDIQQGYADLKLSLSPFKFDIGQAVLFHDGFRYDISGDISATQNAYDLSLALRADALTAQELKTIWPKSVSTDARRWVFRNVEAARLHDIHMVLTGPTLKDAKMLLGGRMTEGRVRVVPALPPATGASGYLSIADSELVVSVDSGSIAAPGAGPVDASGSTFTIPDVRDRPGNGIAELELSSPARDALELLALEPFTVFDGTDFGPDVLDGRMEATVRAAFPLLDHLPYEMLDFDVRGQVQDVTSDKVIAGSVLTADRLDFEADESLLTVWGDGRIGAVPVSATWTQPLVQQEGVPNSTVTGSLQVSQALNEEFNLGLGPSMLSGTAPADFTLTLVPGAAPVLNASSTLEGVRLALPGTGWRKAAGATGDLTLTASLGARPEITDLTLSAPGLSAAGTITTREDGSLGTAAFSRVELGGWLDAPVTLTGRGARPIAISVDGGRADLRGAGFETGSGGGGRAGPDEPLSIRLDEMIFADGIALSAFRGDFDLAGGLSGAFEAQVRNGAQIEGTVAQTAKGAAYRITAQDGGRALDGFGVFSQARGGDLEIVLVPTGIPGTFEGDMVLEDTKLVDAPAMAEMLAAISVIGLIDQLDGQGISFQEVKARFRLSPKRVTLYSSSATSVSLGLSMDGYYNLDTSTMDMQGVLSPFYLINSIGRIVSARDGEGLVGFAFTLTGPDDDLDINVNPLSVLTPGFLREMFRREAPTQPQSGQ